MSQETGAHAEMFRPAGNPESMGLVKALFAVVSFTELQTEWYAVAWLPQAPNPARANRS